MSKAFYKAASDELAGGVRDEALWLRATTEMDGHSDVLQCAHYLRYRARELEAESTKNFVARIAKPDAGRWLVLSAVALVFILGAVMMVRQSDKHELQRVAMDVALDRQAIDIAASRKDINAYGRSIAFMDEHCRYVAANQEGEASPAVADASRFCGQLPLMARSWYAWQATAHSGKYTTDKALAASPGMSLLPAPPFQSF